MQKAIFVTLGAAVVAFLFANPAQIYAKTTHAKVKAQPAAMAVISPAGKTEWQIGNTYTVRYSLPPTTKSKRSGPVRIYLTRDYSPLSAKTGINSALLLGQSNSASNFRFTLPASISRWPGLGEGYRIKVCTDSACKVSAVADAAITLTEHVREIDLSKSLACRGDLNRDGNVDNGDIDLFNKAMGLSLAASNSEFWYADMNADNRLNDADISRFVETLLGERRLVCQTR